MPGRLVLFIDAQNVYEGARETFFSDTDFHSVGQFNPVKLGQLISKKKPFGQETADRTFTEVRVYSGRPNPSKDPQTYGAHRRQTAAWKKQGVTVKTRALRYRYDWPKSKAEEKGVDVALAVDFVVMAVEGEYDIGVIASTDTDLLPAVEYVISRSGVTAEVAAWRDGGNKELSIPDAHLWCHRLTKADYDLIADHRDYNIAS